jgi:Fe2+ or Zn2+ uptake regulation protein
MTSREILKMKSLKATLQRVALLDTLKCGFKRFHFKYLAHHHYPSIV